MRKLLATTAIATMAMTGAASAQSLLERVLGDIQDTGNSLEDITGVFANTADNVLSPDTVPNTVSLGGTEVERRVQVGDEIQVRNDEALITAIVGVDGRLIDENGAPITFGDGDGFVSLGAQLFRDADGNFTVAASALSGGNELGAVTNFDAFDLAIDSIGGDFFSTTGIDASVTNILRGLTDPTAFTPNVNATAAVDAVIGNINTTALGAVNTGEIGLGTNQTVEEAIAGVSEAVVSTVEQIGTQVGSTTLAINSALNETNVNASVLNSMEGVNASIAAVNPDALNITFAGDRDMTQIAGLSELMGTIETTALGAVNTGTIVSGVNNQVNGTIAGITGNSATNMFADD